MQNIRKQEGMTFVSWLVVAALVIFMAVTVIKLVPLYIKYDAVKTIIDKVATEPHAEKLKKRALLAKIDSYIDISSIYDLSSKQFVIEKVRNRKKARRISVKYEDRVEWFANLNIVAVFEHSAIIGDRENLE